MLSCFLSCSLTSPLNDPTRFWCKVRLICWTQSFVCRAVDVCQGLCWCWVGALSSQAMNGLCMKPTSSIHLCVSRCCVLVALDKVQSNYICATVFVAVIFFFFSGIIVHVGLYSLWQFWPVIFQIINSFRLSKYFWLWLCSWKELRKAK